MSALDPHWVETELRDLARRALDGEDREVLERELLTALWPWIIRTADHLLAVLPPSADRDGVRSEIFWECFKAVRRIDWTRYRIWPAYLSTRVRGALSAAARQEDVLTRGQRHAHKLYAAAAEAETQRLGRTLALHERRTLAERLCPRGGLDLVLYGAGHPTSLDAMAFDAPDLAEGPEEMALRRGTVREVSCWISEDLPPRLAGSLLRWLDRPATTLTARLRGSLEPYLPALRDRLDLPAARRT